MAVKFHFLRVGGGDCTIVDFPARIVRGTGEEKDPRIMMVDIHHHEDHDDFEDVITYYKKNFAERSIFRFVATHPHKDHLKGIKTLFEESGISVINFWDLNHNFKPPQEAPQWDDYKEDWEKYSEIRKLEDHEGLCVRRYSDNEDDIKYWNEDSIQILSPSDELYTHAHFKEDGTPRKPEEVDVNNMSYVLLLNVNNLKILLAGDAEERCWEYILENHKEKIKNIDILKAAHHGHLSGLHEDALRVMNPKHVIFSNSSELDYESGAYDEYKKIIPSVKIYKTHELGNIIAECDFDGNINISHQ